MIIDLERRERMVVLAALRQHRLTYEQLSGTEPDPGHRKDLEGCAVAAASMTAKLNASVGPIDLRSGELALIDRALRMNASCWQQTIKMESTPQTRVTVAARVKEIDDVLVRLRHLRGLPW